MKGIVRYSAAALILLGALIIPLSQAGEQSAPLALSDRDMGQILGRAACPCGGGSSTNGGTVCSQDENNSCTCNPLYVAGKLIGMSDNCHYFYGACGPEAETLCTGGSEGNCKVNYPDCSGTRTYRDCHFDWYWCLAFSCDWPPETTLPCPGTRKSAGAAC